MAEGFGCIIGAVVSATISDKISVIKVGKIGMILIIITSALTFTDFLIEPSTLYLPMAVSFLWGITINYITSWESVSCAKLNQGQLESFSIVKQIQAISYIFFTLSMILTDNTIDVPYFLCALTVFCFSSMVVLAVYERFNR